MSVPRPAGESAQRDQTQQPAQATALSTTLHIPSSHAFIPLQQFSFTPTETLGLRNPSDDNNNKPVSVVAQQQQQQPQSLPVVSVVTAVPGLCPPLPVHSMQQAVVGGAPTIIPTVMAAPMTVHAAGLPPTTTMTMTNTLNIGNHLSVAAAASTAAQQQYQALGGTAAGLNLMTSPAALNTSAALNLASSAAVASAINSLNSSILANNANTASALNGSPSNHPSPPTSSSENKSSTKNSSGHNTSNSSSNSSSSNSSPSGNNATTKSTSNNSNSNSNTTSSKSGGTAKNSSSSSSSSQQGASSATDAPDDLVKPVFKDGELVLEVECGQNKGILYLSKLCQGSKGPCISFQTSWLTPNEFQFVSGRETAKDWKRSIRHHGKSLKLLLAKGILNVHPTMCDCDGCRQGATLTRKGEKRRIPNGDRKPRKLSGGGNAGNGNGSGHTGTGVGAGAFRPVGGTPTVASHLTSPGGATAKPEAKRSGGDKQLKIAAAGATPAPDQSPPKNAVLSQEELKSQASAYLDSFNMLGAHKPKPSASTPLRPLELTTPSTDATGACQLTPQSQHSPALSSPASSTSSRSELASPVAPSHPKPQSPSTDKTAADSEEAMETSEDADKTLDLSTSSINCHRTESDTDEKPGVEPSKSSPDAVKKGTEEEEASSEEKAETADSDVASAAEDSDDDDDDDEDVEIKEDTDAPENQVENGKEAVEALPEKCTPESGSSFAGDDAPNTNKTDSSTIKESVEAKEEAEDKPSLPASSSAASLDSAQAPIVSNCSPAPPKQPHPYGISAILGSSFSKPTATSSFSKPTATSSLTESNSTAVVGGVYSQPLSVSVSSNNVKSEHIWVPPTLSPTASGSLSAQLQRSPSDHHNNNNNININHKAKSLSSSSSTPHHHGKTVENGSTISESSNTHSHSVAHHHRPHEQVPAVNDPHSKEQLAGQHGIKSSLPNMSKPNPARREHNNASVKPERSGERERDMLVSPNTNSHHLSSTPDKNTSREKEREERQRQRAREERNRKDREREERRERERREEKEAERRRQEEKERRVSQAEQGKQDGVSAAAPGLAGPGSDPSRRPPGGIADAAAFSDYMRVLAAGHGHAMIPASPGYVPSLYGLRPQDTAAAYSQLLHPMSMYGPAATAAAGGLPKDAASSLLFPGAAGALAGFGPSPLASLHPLLAARSQYGGAGPSLLDYQRSLAAASSSSSSSSAQATTPTSPYAAWPAAAAAYPYLLPDLMAASSPQAAAAAAAGIKRHSSEMEAAMELNAKRMRLEGRPPEFTSPWDYFAAAAAASQHHHQQQQQHQHQQQQQQHHQQQQQQQRAAAAFGHPALSCGLESASSFDKNSAEYLRKRYLEYAASNPHAAAYLSALPEYARTMSVYGQAAGVCPEHRDQDIRLWGVEDVCKFLTTLEGCGIYAEHFREQRVDGRILSLLSSEHLVKTLGMKLGPALLLAEAVAKRLQDLAKMAGCEACRAAALSNMQAMQAMHPMMSLPL